MADGDHGGGAHLGGGLKRIVLGHGHSDHRGARAEAGRPDLCHPTSARTSRARPPASTAARTSPRCQPAGAQRVRRLSKVWDGGPVKVDKTVYEGDDDRGFEVMLFAGTRRADRAVARVGPAGDRRRRRVRLQPVHDDRHARPRADRAAASPAGRGGGAGERAEDRGPRPGGRVDRALRPADRRREGAARRSRGERVGRGHSKRPPSVDALISHQSSPAVTRFKRRSCSALWMASRRSAMRSESL